MERREAFREKGYGCFPRPKSQKKRKGQKAPAPAGVWKAPAAAGTKTRHNRPAGAKREQLKHTRKQRKAEKEEQVAQIPKDERTSRELRIAETRASPEYERFWRSCPDGPPAHAPKFPVVEAPLDPSQWTAAFDA